MEHRKVKNFSEVGSFLPEKLGKTVELIEEVVETNEEKLEKVFSDV